MKYKKDIQSKTINSIYLQRLKLGLRAEAYFKQLVESHGLSWQLSTIDVDRYHHIDCYVKDNRDDRNQYLKTHFSSVEIKSIKNISTANPNLQDDYIWLELHGVLASDKSWIYDGKADVIAFEMKQSFWLVIRERLKVIIDKQINKNQFTSVPEDALYKVYKGRKGYDEMTLVKREDLENHIYTKFDKIEPFDVTQLRCVLRGHQQQYLKELYKMIKPIEAWELSYGK